MTQQKHKLALRSVYCCSNTRQINSSTLFRSSHASRNRKEVPRMLQGLQAHDFIWGHGGWWAEDGAEGVQTHMATAIPTSGQLTRLVSRRQQFVSCRPAEEWKNEAVWSMEVSAGFETKGEGSPSLWHVRLLGPGLSASIIYQASDVWHGARTTGESDLTDWSHVTPDWSMSLTTGISDLTHIMSTCWHGLKVEYCVKKSLAKLKRKMQLCVSRKKKRFSMSFIQNILKAVWHFTYREREKL